MFSNNMVVALKLNGKFFHEVGDKIYIPYDSEYSLYFKNLNSRKAVIKVSIDGKDVLDGKRLIVHGKSFVELEGFMNGDKAINKFKFIPMTERIANFRGETPEDGIISVTFDFEEQEKYYYPYTLTYTWNPTWTFINGHDNNTYPDITYGSDSIYSTTRDNTRPQSQMQSRSSMSLSGGTQSINFTSSVPINDSGISVKGSDINQQFHYGYIGQLENKPTTISFKLIGLKEESKPTFTSDRIKCSICGTESKPSKKFCVECGTRLSE